MRFSSDRRRLLAATAALPVAFGALPLPAAVPVRAGRLGRVVVVGGGFAGATVARYLRWLEPTIDVQLVTPAPTYWTCPFSNTVIGGLSPIPSLEQGYEQLVRRSGVELIVDSAIDFDPVTQTLVTAGGLTLGYDRLVVAPGVEFIWDSPEGYGPDAVEQMPHAWRAGAQTALLAERVSALGDGDVALISVPRAPFRCPPGPYERASLIAHQLAARAPRAKVLILDSNEHFSKQGLFQSAWDELYGDRIEWVSASADGAVVRVDAARGEVFTEFERFRPGLANIIPAQRAGAIARKMTLVDDTGWCPVRAEDFASTRVPGVHVLGDAANAHPMPKSASAANSQAKQCAVAIVAALRGEPQPAPLYHSTCYSFVAPEYGISVTGLYAAGAAGLASIPGAGGLSAVAAETAVRAAEASQAHGWYASITRDAFG